MIEFNYPWKFYNANQGQRYLCIDQGNDGALPDGQPTHSLVVFGLNGEGASFLPGVPGGNGEDGTYREFTNNERDIFNGKAEMPARGAGASPSDIGNQDNPNAGKKGGG